MANNNDSLMTADKFNEKMSEWGLKVSTQAKAVIEASTHSDAPRFRDGSKNKKLSTTVESKVKIGPDGWAKWIGFSFIRSGIWLAYGVGRGWVMQNGQLVQGSRVKKGGQLYMNLKKKGYSGKDMRKYVVRDKNRINAKPRTPVDWLDHVIKNNMQEVADINGEYFGDKAAEKILESFDRMTIRKGYTEIEVK